MKKMHSRGELTFRSSPASWPSDHRVYWLQEEGRRRPPGAVGCPAPAPTPTPVAITPEEDAGVPVIETPHPT